VNLPVELDCALPALAFDLRAVLPMVQ